MHLDDLSLKVWLDDVRDPPSEDWIVCRNLEDVKRNFLLFGIYGEAPDVMSFDHDLGDGEPDGYDVIKWIVRVHPALYPKVVEVHSANGPGAENIEKYDEWYRRMLNNE